MKAHVRLEIIVNKLRTEEVIELLDAYAIRAYTLIENAKGLGARGLQDGSGLTDSFTNSYFLVVCEQDAFKQVRRPLTELLQDMGGVAFAGEVDWLGE